MLYNISTSVVESGPKWCEVVRFAPIRGAKTQNVAKRRDSTQTEHRNLTKGAGKMSEIIIDLKNEFKHTVDAKNRLFIPAKHREMLGRDFVVCRSHHGECLRIYPREEWIALGEKIDKLPGAKSNKFRHFIYRFAIDGEPDAQGRIVLNEGLMSHAQIKKDAVILGLGKYAEIWSAELYAAEIANEEENQEDSADIAEEFGL